MKNLKLYTRVAKEKIDSLFKKISSNVKFEEVVSIPSCNTCPIHNLQLSCDNEENKKDFCLNHCPNKKMDKKVLYHHKYDTKFREIIIPNRIDFNLSKSAIKQYILYHFIPHNNSFVRKGVSYTFIAKSCNISVPTARENHKKLVEAGFVFSVKNSNLMDIVITDEYSIYSPGEEYDLECSESKKSEKAKLDPYITLSLELLKNILEFNNINELKVEFKKILRADAEEGLKQRNIRLKTVNKDNLVSSLPSYIKKSKDRVAEVLNSKQSKFKMKGSMLDTSNLIRPSELRDKVKDNLSKNIYSLFEKHNQPFSNNYFNCKEELLHLANLPKNPLTKEQMDLIITELNNEASLIISDLTEQAIRFGIKNTMNAIKEMFNEHTYANYDGNIYTHILNTGAYIRSLLMKKLNTAGFVNM